MSKKIHEIELEARELLNSPKLFKNEKTRTRLNYAYEGRRGTKLLITVTETEPETKNQ